MECHQLSLVSDERSLEDHSVPLMHKSKLIVHTNCVVPLILVTGDV